MTFFLARNGRYLIGQRFGIDSAERAGSDRLSRFVSPGVVILFVKIRSHLNLSEKK